MKSGDRNPIVDEETQASSTLALEAKWAVLDRSSIGNEIKKNVIVEPKLNSFWLAVRYVASTISRRLPGTIVKPINYAPML